MTTIEKTINKLNKMQKKSLVLMLLGAIHKLSLAVSLIRAITKEVELTDEQKKNIEVFFEEIDK